MSVLVLAGCFYLLAAAALMDDPAVMRTFGTTTRNFLWESRVLDIIVQFVAMLAGALGILALTNEVRQ